MQLVISAKNLQAVQSAGKTLVRQVTFVLVLFLIG